MLVCNWDIEKSYTKGTTEEDQTVAYIGHRFGKTLMEDHFDHLQGSCHSSIYNSKEYWRKFNSIVFLFVTSIVREKESFQLCSTFNWTICSTIHYLYFSTAQNVCPCSHDRSTVKARSENVFVNTFYKDHHALTMKQLQLGLFLMSKLRVWIKMRSRTHTY